MGLDPSAATAGGLGGAVGAAAGKVTLLTTALVGLKDSLNPAAVGRMESALYDMQAATGMSVAEAKRLGEEFKKLGDISNQYSRTTLVTTLSQLKAMPTALSNNTQMFEKFASSMVKFSKANAPEYMARMNQMIGQYPQFIDMLNKADKSAAAFHAAMKYGGVQGMEAYGKAVDAMSGKVDDASDKIRSFQEAFKSLGKGVEDTLFRMTESLTAFVKMPGFDTIFGGAQKYDILSSMVVGAGITRARSYIADTLSAKKGGQRAQAAITPSAGMAAPTGVRPKYDPTYGIVGYATDEELAMQAAPTSRWGRAAGGLNARRSLGGFSSMGVRYGLGMAGATALSVGNILETQNGQSTASTLLGVGGSAAMGAVVAGPLGAAVGAAVGSINELAKAASYASEVMDESFGSEMSGWDKFRTNWGWGLAPSDKEQDAAWRRNFEKTQKEKSLLFTAATTGKNVRLSAEEEAAITENMGAKYANLVKRHRNAIKQGAGQEATMLATEMQQYFGVQEQLRTAQLGASSTSYDALTAMGAGAETTLPLLLAAQKAQRGRTGMYATELNVRRATLASRPNDEAAKIAVAEMEQKLASERQSQYTLDVKAATEITTKEQERLQAMNAMEEARVDYMSGPGSPEKELRVLQNSSKTIALNVKLLRETLAVTTEGNKRSILQNQIDAEAYKGKMAAFREQQQQQQVIITKKEHEINMLEEEKQYQEQANKYRGGSLASSQLAVKQIAPAMDALKAAKQQLDNARANPDVGGENVRAAERGFMAAKRRVGGLMDYARRSVTEAITASAMNAPGGSSIMPFDMGEMQKYGPAWMAIPGFRSGSPQNAPTRTRLQDPYRSLNEQIAALLASMEAEPKGTSVDPYYVRLRPEDLNAVPHM